MITISTGLFWLLISLSTISVIHILIILFFPTKDFAEEMVSYYQDIWEDVLPGIVAFFQAIIGILLYPFGYIIFNFFVRKEKIAQILSRKDKRIDYFLNMPISQRKFTKKLNEEELEEYHSVINGNILFIVIGRKNTKLMKRIHNNDLYWKRVSMYVTNELMETFKDRLDWNIVISSNHIDKENVIKYQEYIDWDNLVATQEISESLFFEYADRIKFEKINLIKNLWAKPINHSSRLKVWLQLRQ